MNWLERIDDLEKNWTPEKQQEARELARSWTTCMCGQQDPAIPRAYNGVPVDLELGFLGTQFSWTIHCRLWPEARDIGRQIQIRAAWVLANLNQQEVKQQEAATCAIE